MYRTEENHYYTFMIGLDPELKGITVGLYSLGLNMEAKAGSNLFPITGWGALNGLLKVPHNRLNAYKPIPIKLESSGLYNYWPRFLYIC